MAITLSLRAKDAIPISKSRGDVNAAIRSIIEHGYSAVGSDFFPTLSLQLSAALEADYVIIGTPSEDQESVKSVAVCADGAVATPLTYNLKGTPCENVVGRFVCVYPNRVDTQFPDDPILAELGIKGYVGVPLFGSKGQARHGAFDLVVVDIGLPDMFGNVLIDKMRAAHPQTKFAIVGDFPKRQDMP